MVSEKEMSNSKASSPVLLFCDTFNHEREFEEIHLDLVGFPQPVAIHEVRIIPHGCRFHTEIKDKFGETSPSSFKLEVFAKNLNKPTATVFEKLGNLDYKDKACFQLEAASLITTNVVLLRGWYNCLTVCLYGEFTEIAIDSNQAPPPPPPPHHPTFGMQPPPKQMTPISQGMTNIMGMELDRREHGSLPPDMMKQDLGSSGVQVYDKGYTTEAKQRGPIGDSDGRERSRHDTERRDRGKEISGDKREKDDTHEGRRKDGDGREKSSDKTKRPGSGKSSEIRSVGETTEARDSTKDGRERAQESPSAALDSLFEPLSPEEADFFDMPNDGANDEIGYEDIESDEDNFDDFDFEETTADLSTFQDLDLYGSEDTWMSVSVSFNPYQCDLSSLESFEVPGLSEFDRTWKNVQNDEKEGKEDITGSSEAKQLLSYIEEFRRSPINAKWVSMLEDIPQLLPQSLAYLNEKSTLNDALTVLVKWTSLALDFDEAMKLPVGVNIRQIKAGIKLASFLCRCNENIAGKLMDAGIQRQLMSLLRADNMASSIRLLVIQALDSTTDMAVGIEHFLGWNINVKDESKNMKKKSPYEDVVMYLLTDPAVRVVTALKKLLRKIHFYESLANLQNFAEKLCSSVKSEPEDTEGKDEIKKEEQTLEIKELKTEDNDQTVQSGKDVFEIHDTLLSSGCLDTIVTSLHDVYKIIENSQELISQPALKSFPTSAKVIESSQNESLTTVFSLLRKRRFLESLLIIMSSPIFYEPALFATIRDMMFFLLDDEKGLIFLASEPNTVNGMIRVLTQSSEAETHPSEAPSLKELKFDPNVADNCVAHQLGLLLIYHLQSLQGIDQLISAEKKGISPSEMDDANILSTLHTLYSMTFTPIGKVAVSSVLSQRDNLRCLMPFIEHTDEGEGKTRRSVSSKYASVLLLLTIQISDNIKSLEKFGSKLLTVHKKDGDTVLTELGHYLAPLDRIIRVDTNAIVNLVEYIKGELDSFKTNANSPRGVYSALRLLKYICIPPKREQQAEQKDLKWSLAIIQLFSANAIDTFIQLLSKLGERLVTPWRQNQAFSSHHCFVLVNMAVPLLQLIHGILVELINSGKVPFKDARLLNGIFVLHTILCSRPVAGQLFTTISQIQSEIVNILLKFTSTTAPESQDVLRASSWYLMLKELVQYTCSKPQAFLSGVVLLSELLPVPFPVNTAQDLSQEDMKTLSNHRLLWMAHIGALGDEIQSMLKSLVGSCCTYLQHSVRKLCLQLCDLGAITSLSTIRFLCEALSCALSKVTEIHEQAEDNEKEQKEELSNNSYAARIVSLLSSSVSQPGGKLAFLHLIRQGDENSESEFSNLVPRMIDVVKSDKKPTDNSALMEGILGIFVSICDAQITINEYQDPFKPQNLASNLPDAKIMQDIAIAVLSLSCDTQQQYQLVINALRVLMSFTDHNHGISLLRKALDENGEKLFNLIERLKKDILGKENQDEVMNTFSTAIEFIRLLLPLSAVNEDNDQRSEEFTQTIRKVHVTSAILRRYLKIEENTESHPLFAIKQQLEDDGKEDLNAEPLCRQLALLIESLQKEDDELTDEEPQDDVQLPSPQTIHELFNERLFFIAAMMEDDRLAPMMWYLSPPPEDVESDSDMVTVDLEAIAEKYCPGFQLKEEVEKGFITTDEQAKRTKRSKRKFDPLVHGKGDHIDDLKRQRLDVSWLQRGRGSFRGRGRGFGRGHVDMFRSRKQNTSRPPSMHVDDFIAMENNSSPSDSQGKQPIKQSSFGGPVRTATSEPRFTGGFNNSDGRWASPGQGSFRRDVDHVEMNRAGFGTWGGQSTFAPQYGRGNGAFPRGGSSWSPQIPSPYRAPRESQSAYPRSSFRGGYWAGPKPKDDGSRFFAGGALGNYRQNQGTGRDGFNRHMRTFTR